MTPAATRDAIELFEELVDLSKREREDRLTLLAGRDPELVERVRRMLVADSGAPLEREHLLAGALPGPQAGSRIGPYRILRELGRGGMGTVYLAERVDGAFARTVAIKWVRTLGAGDELPRRFELERRVLARLEHPGITRILDGGVTERNEPYLVMEYVDGEPIDRFCDRERLTVRARLRLFQEVCHAVRYAHRALVVHRDLKPQNILVDRDGRPRLLDFGIAKLISGDGVSSSTLTRSGGLPFTPAYASPEQILGRPISTASDVYSLGVLLFELLTGETPFRVPVVTPGDLVRSAESRRAECPGRRLSRIDTGTASRRAELRGTHLKALLRELGGDLDRIVAKALEPDPEQRYASVDHLEEDLQRFLSGRPVRARPASPSYRARLFVRRHRLPAAAAVLVALLILGGSGAALWQRGVALEARERFELEASRARATSRFLVSLFEAGGTYPWIDRDHKGPRTPIIEVLDEASRRLDEDLSTGDAELADLHVALGTTFLSLRLRERAERHFERALELRRAALGEVHEDTARAWYFAASAAPTLEGAIHRGRRSVEVEEELDRPSTNYPFALADLSSWLTRAGHLREAGTYLERASAATRGLPEQSLARFNVLHREIDLAYATGRLDAMERLIEHGEGRFQDPYALNFAVWRGQLALRRGRPDEAVRHLRVKQRAHGERGQPFFQTPSLVTALVRSGSLAEAEEAAGQLRLPAGEALRYEHAESLAALARLELARGRPGACERSARAAVQVLERELTRPTLELAEALAVLGDCLRALGRPAEADTYSEQSRDAEARVAATLCEP